MAIITINTTIEGNIPKEQLPLPPKNYYWTKKRIPVKKYVYQTKHIPVKKYYYTWITVPYRTKRFFTYRRKRIYLKRRRIYYTGYVIKKVRIRKTLYQYWWVLNKKVKDVWVDTLTFIRQKYKEYDIKEEDVFVEHYPPYEYIDINTQFCYYNKWIPKRTYNLVFFYYLAKPKKVYKEEGKKYILVSSSFFLGRELSIYEISKNEIPKMIGTTIDRMSGHKVNFIGKICFSATTKREVEEGRRT
jgi:hypothetical protein